MPNVEDKINSIVQKLEEAILRDKNRQHMINTERRRIILSACLKTISDAIQEENTDWYAIIEACAIAKECYNQDIQNPNVSPLQWAYTIMKGGEIQTSWTEAD